MKKQINPTIKAHLVRGAFYLLLLLAVCAIPLALAQSLAKPPAKPSLTRSATGPNVSGIALSRLTKLPIAQRSPRAGESPKQRTSFGAVLLLSK